jgi:hypothetical protein
VLASSGGHCPHNFLPKMLSYLNTVILEFSLCRDRLFDLIWFPSHETGFMNFSNPKFCILRGHVHMWNVGNIVSFLLLWMYAQTI